MKWLHISDLHYNPETSNFDSSLLLLKLEEYLVNHSITVDEIFYTGDFRFAKTQKPTQENARLVADKLKEIAEKAGVRDPESIHIVPGNHDLERGEPSFLSKIYEQYSHGQFSGTIDCMGAQISCSDYLWERFQFFRLVAAELGNQIWLNSPQGKHPSFHRIGKIGEKYNIVYLNTALGSGKDGERTNLRAGYEYISQTLKS